MATRRYAKAIASNHNVPYDEWMEVLRKQNEGIIPADHVHRMAKTVLRKADPRKFLLSHATIVASVDTYAPKNAKSGRLLNRGSQIDVRWPEYRIKPDCNKIVNNNLDAWERSLLLSTYRTFIGAQNYLEHIQLKELAKGFVVDAIARDLGSTCYVDILVATDRKHQQLVQDILDGKLTTMSMGCISAFTTCTKCGNVATDESQLCPCILYDGKGSEFYDEDGQKNIVAELIGHVSVPNSNQFIEASWVANPAFRGAVRRNFLNPDLTDVESKIQEAMKISADRSPSVEGLKKAASVSYRMAAPSLLEQLGLSGGDGGGDQGAPPDQDSGDQGGQGAGGQQGGQDGQQKKDEGGKSQSEDDKITKKIDKMIESAQERIMDLVMSKLEERMTGAEEVGEVLPPPKNLIKNDSNLMRASFDYKLNKKFAHNEGLVRWASDTRKLVSKGDKRAIKTAGFTPRDLIVLSWIDDNINNRVYSPDLYRVAMSVGPMNKFATEKAFLVACETKAKRSLSDKEKAFLLWKAKIANLASF